MRGFCITGVTAPEGLKVTLGGYPRAEGRSPHDDVEAAVIEVWSELPGVPVAPHNKTCVRPRSNRLWDLYHDHATGPQFLGLRFFHECLVMVLMAGIDLPGIGADGAESISAADFR